MVIFVVTFSYHLVHFFLIYYSVTLTVATYQPILPQTKLNTAKESVSKVGELIMYGLIVLGVLMSYPFPT